LQPESEGDRTPSIGPQRRLANGIDKKKDGGMRWKERIPK